MKDHSVPAQQRGKISGAFIEAGELNIVLFGPKADRNRGEYVVASHSGRDDLEGLHRPPTWSLLWYRSSQEGQLFKELPSLLRMQRKHFAT